jgi:branched-chain amino acid aminotransferase
MDNLLIYINGELKPKAEAMVSVYDHGVLYGDGVFEGIRAYGDEVFKLDEHLERLYRSAHFLHIVIPQKLEELRDAVLGTLKANNLYNGAYIRLVVTRGVGDLGINPKKCTHGPTIFIITDTIQLYPPEFYEKGIRTIICSTRKHSPQCINPQVKATQYLNNIMALIEATNAGMLEAIMLSLDGFVTEGSADNIFITRGKRIITPPVYLGALEGITRSSVMEIATENGYTVEEKRFTSFELYEAEECWFTGTAAELIPVIEVDSRTIGSGKPGPIFHDLKSQFAGFVKKHGTKIPR